MSGCFRFAGGDGPLGAIWPEMWDVAIEPALFHQTPARASYVAFVATLG
jgi:hypothetical protein